MMSEKKKNEVAKAEMSLPELLKADSTTLSPEQAELQALYLQTAQEEDEEMKSIDRPDRLEIGHSSQLFKMPDGTGTDNVEMLILGFITTRGAWSGSGDDSRQICSSIGGSVGVPTKHAKDFEFFKAAKYLSQIHPLCAACPLNEWDTAVDDKGNPAKGKYCKEMRRNLIILKGFNDGLEFNITPTNLSAYDDYRRSIKKKGKKVFQQWTKVKAIKEQSGNMVWSKFVFSEGDPITLEEFRVAAQVRERFKEAIKQEVQNNDYFGDPNFSLDPDVEDDEPPVHGDEDYRKPEKIPHSPTDDDDDLPF